MKLEVLEVFQDLETMQHYNVGDVIDISNKERAEKILKLKLGKAVEEAPSKRQPKKKAVD